MTLIFDLPYSNDSIPVMPRIARVATGGIVQHVLNRGNGRMDLFHKSADYAAFGDRS